MHLERIKFDDSALSKGWLRTRLAMSQLFLSYIEFSTIENDAFNSEEFKYCCVLQFNHVPIQGIKSGAFNGLERLNILRIDFSELYEFPEQLFAPTLYLQTLRLRDCGEPLLNIDNLFANVKLEYLETVIINRCNMKDTITAKTFPGLFKLEKLYLNYDQIEEIGPHAFDDCINNLALLVLDSNKLKKIPSDLFKTSREISSVFVHLHNNPFHCDCDLDYLRAAAQSFGMVIFTNMVCATPPKYAGHSLKECKASFCSEIKIQIDKSNEPPSSNELANYLDASSGATLPKPKPIKPALSLQIPANTRENAASESPGSPDEISPISAHSGRSSSFTVKCEMSQRESSMFSRVTLKNKSGFKARIFKGQLLISAAFRNYNFKFLEFVSKYDGRDECFVNLRKTRGKGFQLKQKFQSNHLYRFCWIDKRSKAITALDCTSFFTLVVEPPMEPWIWANEKGKIIFALLLIMVLALVLGVLVVVILKYKYPQTLMIIIMKMGGIGNENKTGEQRAEVEVPRSILKNSTVQR